MDHDTEAECGRLAGTQGAVPWGPGARQRASWECGYGRRVEKRGEINATPAIGLPVVNATEAKRLRHCKHNHQRKPRQDRRPFRRARNTHDQRTQQADHGTARTTEGQQVHAGMVGEAKGAGTGRGAQSANV